MRDSLIAARLSNMSESTTLALNARVKQLAAEGKTVYNLTAGELAGDTPEYIQKYVGDKLQLNKYTPVAGLPELRQKIAVMASELYGLDWVKPENVIVTAGAKPALFAALMALINPGDEVIVPTPAWVSYSHLIELAGGKVVEVPLTKDYDLDPDAIASKLSPRTKAILLNSPHNPTGSVFSKNSIEQLAELLKGAGLTVISDDIYAKLIFTQDFTPVPAVDFDNIVIISGFSKSQALTGWRIGYAVADTEIIKAMTSILSHVMGNAAVPSQLAAMAALSNNDTPPPATLQGLMERRQLVKQHLDKISGLSYHLPEGAFYFLIDLTRITTDSAGWCEQLLNRTGVALVPGEAFAAPGSARLTFVTDQEVLEAALVKLGEFVNGGTK